MQMFVKPTRRRGTVLLMIVGLLAMLFVIVSAYILLAFFDRERERLSARGDRVEEMAQGVVDLVAAHIRGPSGQPGAGVIGRAYHQTPAYEIALDSNTKVLVGDPWRAAPEPVRNPTRDWRLNGPLYPEDMRYGAVTSLAAEPGGARRTSDLMRNIGRTGTSEPWTEVLARPGDAGNLLAANRPSPDAVGNARYPEMDATGDGIPDALFAGSAPATEIVNAIAGRLATASGLDPARINVNPNPSVNVDEMTLRYRQFDRSAQLVVPVRVVPHGGMLQLTGPADAARAQFPGGFNVGALSTQWNYGFTGHMFDWLRNSRDGGTLFTDLQLLNMHRSAEAIEPILRGRGMLPPARDELVPEALLDLQNRYPYTFNVFRNGGRPEPSQRFNLASGDDWIAWAAAAAVDPYRYNRYVRTGLANPRAQYAARQAFTLYNYSDELARVFPSNYAQDTLLGLPPSLRPGTVKFPLWRLANAFNASNARFITSNDNAYDGLEVTRDLLRYYHEMLKGHNSTSFKTLVGTGNARVQHAAMLAVNTLAFAAPRDNAGHPDAPYAIRGNHVYVGYTPQPFISRVVVYNKPTSSSDGPTQTVRPAVALAFELYNPYDSQPGSTATDLQLDLTRYAISINDQFDPIGERPQFTRLHRLSEHLPATRMPGRSFVVLAVNNTSNTFFDTLPNVAGRISEEIPYRNAGARIRVKLWRQAESLRTLLPEYDGWYQVDEMELRSGDANIPDTEVDPQIEWSLDMRRDMRFDPWFGQRAGRPARWRMVVAFPPDNFNLNASASAPIGPATALGTGHGNAIEGLPSNATPGPSIPLYTMNAGLSPIPIHGAWRPASFPTLGFLHLVPRVSHIITVDGGSVAQHPAPKLLYELLENYYGNENGLSGPVYPADFGFMPVLDNRQEPASGTFIGNDRVPWGMLVHDTFTLFDIDGGYTNQRVDPYRIPGRIDINVAPWHVLAELPMVGPAARPFDPTARLPLDFNLPNNQVIPPWFWDPDSGILAGEGYDGQARFPALQSFTFPRTPLVLGSGEGLRLGPVLAQAAAAYRDRMQYASALDTQDGVPDGRIAYAHARGYSLYGYRAQDQPGVNYGPIRGATYDPDDPNLRDSGLPPSTAARGFLTVGELLNVIGIDGYEKDQQGALLTYGPIAGGDYLKAVSRLMLLDTLFLTTRSNVFTVYTTLYDRENPQASVRVQVTLDRTNTLPRVIERDSDNDGIVDEFVVLQNDGLPQAIGARQVSYFNTRFDQ